MLLIASNLQTSQFSEESTIDKTSQELLDTPEYGTFVYFISNYYEKGLELLRSYEVCGDCCLLMLSNGVQCCPSL